MKVLEAMSQGKAIVSTSTGCEGLAVVDGEHLLIADTPHDFASATLRLLRDRSLRELLGTSARKQVEANYSWDRITSNLRDIYRQVAVEQVRA